MNVLIFQKLIALLTLADHLLTMNVISVKNLNRLLREHSPKKRTMSIVSDEEIKMFQNTRVGVSSSDQGRFTSNLNPFNYTSTDELRIKIVKNYK